MTQRKPTMAQTVETLKIIMENRRARINGLTKILPTCSAKDKKEIEKEIVEHEKWISDAEKVIKNFYRPARSA